MSSGAGGLRRDTAFDGWGPAEAKAELGEGTRAMLRERIGETAPSPATELGSVSLPAAAELPSALIDATAPTPTDRAWLDEAVRRIQADANRSADTHLVHVPIPGLPDVDLYLKDESTHPTGSLKHRLARSLFLYGLCNGWIVEEPTAANGSNRCAR